MGSNTTVSTDGDEVNPFYYLTRFILGTSDFSEKSRAFVSDWLHSVFSNGKIEGNRLLDVGTGPNINSVIYAAPFFEKIYLSDKSDEQRMFLKNWWRENDSIVMHPLFQDAIMRDGKGKTPANREMRLKQRLVEVVSCDILQENPMHPSIFRQFDAITVSWTLDGLARSIGEYIQILQNIRLLLKTSGHLVLLGINNAQSSYVNSSVRITNLEEVESLLTKAGFSVEKKADRFIGAVHSETGEMLDDEPCYLYNVLAVKV